MPKVTNTGRGLYVTLVNGGEIHLNHGETIDLTGEQVKDPSVKFAISSGRLLVHPDLPAVVRQTTTDEVVFSTESAKPSKRREKQA